MTSLGHFGKCGAMVSLPSCCHPPRQGFLLFPQGLPISMYGGTLIPSHPQLADGPGGPLFNGLHTPDPAWNPMIKVVQNSTECPDAQQVEWLPSPPHLPGAFHSGVLCSSGVLYFISDTFFISLMLELESHRFIWLEETY